MTIFVVMSVTETSELASRIATTFPNDYLQITSGQWLVSADMTAKELSDRLDVSKGIGGKTLVAAISSYYGRHSTNVWEWIRVKWEGGPNGG